MGNCRARVIVKFARSLSNNGRPFSITEKSEPSQAVGSMAMMSRQKAGLGVRPQMMVSGALQELFPSCLHSELLNLKLHTVV